LKVKRIEIDRAGKIVLFTGEEVRKTENEWDAVE
jgi:hypothetical protein